MNKTILEELKKTLLGIVKKIDNNECDIDLGNPETLMAIKNLKGALDNTDRLSKTQAAEYIQVSRATFDRLVQEGKIPHGTKVKGFKELSWSKGDLKTFLKENSGK